MISDSSLVTIYSKGCYEYKHFTKCIKIYEKYSKNVPDFDNHEDAQQMKLYKGKSLFHMYRRQAFQMRLFEERGVKSGKEYKTAHKRCFDDARDSIDLLISAFDSGFIDDEGKKMLDLAVIDYSKETNKLNDFNHCLLCHKTAKLQRSHVFPKSILEKFCKSMSRPENTKQNITPMRPGPLQSSKSSMTTFLFCEACEGLLNRNGEMQFSPMFLDILYNVKSPDSPSSEHHIEYDKWLYQFCVGLLFRLLGQFYPYDYHNDADIYQFFIQCREYLLSTSTSAVEGHLPDIAVLINPNAAPAEKSKLGFMNYALNYPLEESSLSLPLDGVAQKTPEEICYFLVHFGVINVIGIIDPAQKVHLPSDCFIQESGGVLHIPDNHGRFQAMPRGLWMFFEQAAAELETEYVRMSLSRLNWQKDNVLSEPPQEVVNMFGFVPSYEKDIKNQERILHPASIAGVEKTLNFLPGGFQVNHRNDQSSVIIPKDHKLILHYTCVVTTGKGYSLFLAVGNDSPGRPYIIYHLTQHLGGLCRWRQQGSVCSQSQHEEEQLIHQL